MELADRWALVTGGARRIGRAIALALGQAGANVAVHYRSSAAEAEMTAADIRAFGREAMTLRADLALPAEIAALFAALAEKVGRLNILVNSAAVFARTPIESLTAEQWDAQHAVNARAAALCIRHALKLMPAGGVIVTATRPKPSYLAYCASKAALLSLTAGAAKALARRGIRVNAVSPGVALWPEGMAQADKDNLLARVPLGRAGTPEDVAAAVVFLCRCDYVTGENLHVDGGWHLG
jgi:NAD(P)-dependent dehydrogenase (short-subunit alcohol dehydrogenase family)